MLLSPQTWHNFKHQQIQPLLAAGGAVEEYDNQQELGVRGGIVTVFAFSLIVLVCGGRVQAAKASSNGGSWNLGGHDRCRRC